MNNSKMMQIVGAVTRTARTGHDEKKTFWTRIGVAFQNKDGSWNLRFDYVPTRLNDTTIQMREMDPKEAVATAE